MKKIILFIIITITFFTPNNLFSNDDINPKIEEKYNNLFIKIEKQYSTINKQIDILTQLNSILNTALKNSKISNEKKEIISDLVYLNNKKLTYLKIKNQIINNSKEEENKELLAKTNEENFNKLIKEKNNYTIDKYKITTNFSKKSYNYDNIFLENGVWYYYKISQYKYFKDLENVKLSDIEYNGINTKNSLVFMIDNTTVGFTNDYEKIKLISDNIIYGISNKYNFLLEVKDDKKNLSKDTDELFKTLKNETILLTNGLTNDQKIEKIYNYLIENLEYTKIVNFENHEIFSGIITYKNKTGVCEGYAKLFVYMLNFSGIGNVELIRGNVIDAVDFPKIGHAWLKIDDKYYDPTFDDPIGLTKNKTKEDYQYFGLPKDLFYTNRYTYEDTPEELKTKDLGTRQNIVKQNLINISEKYKNNNYVILKEINFKKKYNIDPKETINLSNLNKIFPLYEVKDFKMVINGKTKIITKIMYYKIEDNNIEDLLKQIKYKTDGYYFLKWDLGDGKYEYRFGYEMILN